jgi:hypothetical protein
MTRRALGDTLVELGLGLLPAADTAGLLRVHRVAVDLPLEIQVRGRGVAAELLADVPRLVTRTAFDVMPSRVVVVWEARA